MDPLQAVLDEARACRVCEAELPLGPRPVLAATEQARVVIIGQAPGTRVHASGVPWADDSGDRLRDWLGLETEVFYGPRVAILPMGLCYPGKKGGGDAPPRPECAPLWHAPVLAALPALRCTLLVGTYAQARYLGPRRERTLTATVAAWSRFAPGEWVLPHPSWRVRGWMKKNPWFQSELLPELRVAMAAALA